MFVSLPNDIFAAVGYSLGHFPTDRDTNYAILPLQTRERKNITENYCGDSKTREIFKRLRLSANRFGVSTIRETVDDETANRVSSDFDL